MKIGFYTSEEPALALGGHNYFMDLFSALESYPTNKVQVCILTHKAQLATSSIPISKSNVVVIPRHRRWGIPWITNSMGKIFFSYDNASAKIFNRNHLDIIVGPVLSYKYGRVRTLSWVYDFQHKYYPNYFSNNQCRARDEIFEKTAEISSRVIVMSESVRSDFKKFMPKYAHKVRVISPVSQIDYSVYDKDPNYVVRQYRLPYKFFYLPNQFWQHKNHGVVIQALSLLKKKGINPSIVCTGVMHDDRNPGYFSVLMQKIHDLNIEQNMISLGVIPYEHVLLLMRQSVGVMNPSLFEGFGLSVDEAKSIGKQVLLSDIPAHHEQKPPMATYFDPKNPEELAEKMFSIWEKTNPGPELNLESSARKALPGRIAQSVRSFLSVAEEIVD